MIILYITHFVNGFLMIAMPIGLVIYLTRKFKTGWRLWWIGAITFIISQVVHLPLNNLLNYLYTQGVIPMPPQAWRLIFFSILGGLTAGLCEELARYAMYRWWAKDARSWSKGVIAGAGHGGAEAIIFGAYVLYIYLQMVAILGADLSKVVPPDQLALAQQQITAYWSAPWYATLLGAVERAFTIPTQIAFSIIVLQVFTRRQIRWLWLAIAWHTIIDATLAGYLARILSTYSWGVYALEGLIGLVALVNIGILFALRQPEPEPAVEIEQVSPPPSAFNPLPLPETPEKLDDTRYN